MTLLSLHGRKSTTTVRRGKISKNVETARVPRKPGIDKRVKLTDAQRAEIIANRLDLSVRKLAALYGVSPRLIHFIQRPESLQANLERREERGGSMQYYKKTVATAAMRKHRRHKRELIDSGLIEINEGE